jgi:methylenetetrahydrofolate reductase (NADH)
MKSKSQLEKVLEAGHFAVTGECGPPRGCDPQIVIEKAKHLVGYVDGVNITDNQTAMVRMSSFAAALLVKSTGLDPIMQMVTRDRNRIAMQSDILGAAAHGINNLLCLSGDHQGFGDHPMAKNCYDLDSIQMLQMVKGMRDDKKFQSGDEIKAGTPDLFIGAAANPFAHPTQIRVPRLAKKAAAGADFIQTQCIFNLKTFEEWLKKAVDRGLHEQTKILAGVTPMKSVGMARYMSKNVAGMDVPDELVQRMAGTEKGKAKEEGIKIAVETIQKIKEMEGVAGVHVMAIEWEEAVGGIVKSAGLYPRPEV